MRERLRRPRSALCPGVSIELLDARRLLHGAGAGEDDHTEALSRAVVSIDAGGAGGVSDDGEVFAADGGFEGGRARQLGGLAEAARVDPIDLSTRQGKNFTFSARVPNGRYTLTLKFADDAREVRRFDVFAEDERIAGGWRVPVQVVGRVTTVERRFNIFVADGRLSLGFHSVAGQATVSAINLNPGYSLYPGAVSWREVNAAMPLRREEAQSFTWQGHLYVLGGYYDGLFRATSRADRFDPRTNTWKRLANLPTPVTHAGVAVDPVTQTAWFVGGYVGDFPAPDGTAAVWKYHIPTNTWSQGPSIPAARGAGGAAIVGRKLYFFSGANKGRTEDQADHWALDLDNPSKWRQRAPLPNPRNHFSTAVVNDQIYVIGGQHLLELDSINQADVHRYDVTTDTWTAMASLPRPYSHFTFSLGVYKDRYIVSAGGESPHDVGRSDALVYDSVRNRWGRLTSLPADRRAAAGGVIGDRLYIAGGYERDIGQSDDVFSVDLRPAFE